MKIKKYSISAIIIVRNEELTVKKVVLEAVQILPKVASNYEILVNNDASTDQTKIILNQLAKKYRFIKVFHQKKSLGITGGLEFLYKKVGYDLAITNSGDGQCTFEDLPNMLTKINEGYDLVIGKRKDKYQYSFLRQFVSFGFNLLPKILFGVNLHDAGSMKLYKHSVLKKTIPISKSVFSEAERIIRTYQKGFKVTSVYIKHFKREKRTTSTIKIRLIVNSMLDMAKLRYTLWQNS